MKIKLGCFILILLIEFSNSLFWSWGYGSGITYQLYTKRNPVNGQPLIFGNLNSVAYSNFVNAKPTRIIIHGYGQNGVSNINRDLKNGYLSRGDYNVIVVDWSSVSSPYYQYARSRVGSTGIAVSKFINFLNPNYATLHVVGFDLGAHVAGIAGKNTVNGKIGKIIGLDPSRPLFNEFSTVGMLSVGDANFVEVFHSNGGQLGIYPPIGNIDYYINNGRIQPECTTNINECSHLRAVATYSRLINKQNNFIVIPCETIADVAIGCTSNPVEFFIEEISPSGIYQIKTVNAEAFQAEKVADENATNEKMNEGENEEADGDKNDGENVSEGNESNAEGDNNNQNGNEGNTNEGSDAGESTNVESNTDAINDEVELI